MASAAAPPRGTGPSGSAAGRSLRVLVSGAGGLIGGALVPELERRGHRVRRLGRGGGTEAPRWDPEGGTIDAEALDGVDAVVHLAGAPIAVRWSAEARRRIFDSRVKGASLLAQAMAAQERPPSVLVSMSAVGYYGERGDERLVEDSPPGRGFLPDVCRAWESATAPAVARGIRVVHPRLGIVLTPRGGARARMLPLFRSGLGGRLGAGRAWWSWIGLPDVLGLLVRALDDPRMSGPVNAVAPEPVRQREFTATLARVLSRPAFLRAPAFALRLVFGRMADETVLSSSRAEPAAALALGHTFVMPQLEGALRRLLARPAGTG